MELRCHPAAIRNIHPVDTEEKRFVGHEKTSCFEIEDDYSRFKTRPLNPFDQIRFNLGTSQFQDIGDLADRHSFAVHF